MDSSEFYNFEDQAYINPKLSSGEQMAFIDKFRDIQNQNNQQIATDTYNLGKALPSNLGGLGGGESYFNARYQNDQVDDMVANLKTAAQAQELSDVMSNYQNQLKRRYNNAQRAYNRRHGSAGGYYTTGGDDGTGGDELDFNTNGQKSGGFWDTWLGKSTADWANKVLSNGKVNTNNSNLQAVGNNLYRNKTTGVTYNTNVPTSLMGFLSGGGGSDLYGVWPNGQKMTEGSTYKWGGKTYTVTSGLSGNKYDIVEIVK